MSDPDRGTMDLAERRRADRMLTQARQAAREEFVKQGIAEAKADAEYRRTKATAFLAARATGAPITESEIIANRDAADAKERRDIASVLARASLLKIQETEREAVTVRDIHSSSERIDGLAP